MRTALSRLTSVTATHVLGRVEVLALFPIVALGATWAGFDNIAVVTATLLAALVALAGVLGRMPDASISQVRGKQNVLDRTGLMAALDDIAARDGMDTACFHIQIDQWDDHHDRLGPDPAARLLDRVEDRIQTTLRNGDLLGRVGDGRFAIVLGGGRPARLDLRDALAGRLANAISDPITLDGHAMSVTVCIGHSALIRRALHQSQSTYGAAEVALADAMRRGPTSIVAFEPHMGRARKLARDLSTSVDDALADGSLTAWFQPQTNAQDGSISGMEALARWEHPTYGTLNPKDFFEALEAAGAMPRLGEAILTQSLAALAGWDAAGANIPKVSVNFSAAELRQPNFPDMVAQALAEQGLGPDRLVIEVLETVAAETRDDQFGFPDSTTASRY